jgi:hypothetical protein
MDSEHRASGQHSPPPRSDYPDTGSLSSYAQNRFINRTISTVSLNSITHLPRYSVHESQRPLDQEDDASTLRDDDLYTHAETTPSPFGANDSDVKTTSPESAPLQDNSNARASVASLLPPQYSSIPPRYSGTIGIPAQNATAEGLPRTEHTYNICSGLKNKPLATFRVFSDPPVGVVQKHQKFPRFSGGDKIAGLIELTLDNSQTVNSITVSVSPSFRMTYNTDAFISFVGTLSEVTLLGNLTHSLTTKSVSGHAPLEIHAFQTKGLRKSSMENLRGHTNSPLLSRSQPT